MHDEEEKVRHVARVDEHGPCSNAADALPRRDAPGTPPVGGTCLAQDVRRDCDYAHSKYKHNH